MLNQQLIAIEHRFHELTARLNDPGSIPDQRAFQSIAKEHAALQPIIETWHTRVRVERDLDNARAMMTSEKDAELQQMAKEEVDALVVQLATIDQSLTLLLLPKDPNDTRDVILEIRAGTGGEEAALFAAELYRMYQRFAERHRFTIEILDSNPTGLGGLKEIIVTVRGQGAYSQLKFESGVHRVQRVPRTETSGRVHTSAATVAVLPEADEVDIAIHESDLRIDVFRASGPGGQGVNTTDSAVRITHVPTGTVVVCREERSQIKNKARAMKLLRTRLMDEEQSKQDASQRAERKSQIGSGDRSEKIRTYNFPQSRVTDHRIGLTLHQIDSVMDGELDGLIEALRKHYQAAALAESGMR